MKESALTNLHKLLLEALRQREQEILDHVSILIPALGGFSWLLEKSSGSSSLHTLEFASIATGIILLFLAGALYTLALGFNYRYILFQIAKLESCLQIVGFILKAWPRDPQAFKNKHSLCGMPWCAPPEIIRIWWFANLGGIIFVTTVTFLKLSSMPDCCCRAQGIVLLIGAICLALGIFAPHYFGHKLWALCDKEGSEFQCGDGQGAQVRHKDP